MARLLHHSVDCGKNTNMIEPVLHRIIEVFGKTPVRRQDGDCNCTDFSVATGTRFIRFCNIPEQDYDAFVEICDSVKKDFLGNAT